MAIARRGTTQTPYVLGGATGRLRRQAWGWYEKGSDVRDVRALLAVQAYRLPGASSNRALARVASGCDTRLTSPSVGWSAVAASSAPRGGRGTWLPRRIPATAAARRVGSPRSSRQPVVGGGQR